MSKLLSQALDDSLQQFSTIQNVILSYSCQKSDAVSETMIITNYNYFAIQFPSVLLLEIKKQLPNRIFRCRVICITQEKMSMKGIPILYSTFMKTCTRVYNCFYFCTKLYIVGTH